MLEHPTTHAIHVLYQADSLFVNSAEVFGGNSSVFSQSDNLFSTPASSTDDPVSHPLLFLSLLSLHHSLSLSHIHLHQHYKPVKPVRNHSVCCQNWFKQVVLSLRPAYVNGANSPICSDQAASEVIAETSSKPPPNPLFGSDEEDDLDWLK